MLRRVAGPSDNDEQLERERRLVERAHAGDRAAVGELLSTHGPALYRSVLLPRLGSDAAARDALPVDGRSAEGQSVARVSTPMIGLPNEPAWMWLLFLVAALTALEWATYHRRMTV